MSLHVSKRLKQGAASIMLAGLAGLSSTSLYAADSILSNMTVEQRLERVERLVGPDVLQKQAQQMDELHQEVSQLRGEVDQLNYDLDMIKQRQRSLYLDMDRRLSALEAGGGGGVRSSGVAPPVVGSGSAPGAGAVATGAATSTASAAPAGSDADGQDAYANAFNLLKEGRYQPSITAFQDFLKTYPHSRYADNAQYWLGEANYVSRDYKTALEEFQRLIAQYPSSTKIPGARLKIGYVYYELKNWSAARDSLQQVIKLYPDNPVAKKAQERIDRMQREGH
jgi:tol-pal system protein YbgF